MNPVCSLGFWLKVNVVCLILFALLPLGTPDVPRGMLDFEFAGSSGEAFAIVLAWEEADRLWAVRPNLVVDMFFLVAYSTLLALITLRVTGARAAWVRVVGWLVAALAWSAGVCDFAENLCLFQMIDPPRDVAPTAAYFAGLKFKLLAVVGGTWLVGIAIWIAGPFLRALRVIRRMPRKIPRPTP